MTPRPSLRIPLQKKASQLAPLLMPMPWCQVNSYAVTANPKYPYEKSEGFQEPLFPEAGEPWRLPYGESLDGRFTERSQETGGSRKTFNSEAK